MRLKMESGEQLTTDEPWRLEEYEAYKQMQSKLEVDFGDKSFEKHETAREFFKISKDKQVVDDMHSRIFDVLQGRMKDRQITFYAFLNKEFNVMNYKSARCSMHCFDNEKKPLNQVNECLKACRSGIQGCKEYAHDQQKTAEQELAACHLKAADTGTMTDPTIHWVSCYEKLIRRFDVIEKDIKTEFSNFI